VLAILRYLLVFVEVVCGLLLIGVILLQRTKGQGVGLAFGSGMGESLFGSRVGNVLTKTTVVLGIVFLVNTTLLALLETGRRQESVTDAVSDRAAPAPQQALPPVAPVPAPATPAPLPADFGTAAPLTPAPQDVAVPGVPAPAAAE